MTKSTTKKKKKKNPPAKTGDAERRWFDPWIGKIIWSRKWRPASVVLTGKSHGAGWAPVHGVAKRVGHDLATKQQYSVR